MISLGSRKEGEPYIIEAETMNYEETSNLVTLENIKMSKIHFLLEALTLYSILYLDRSLVQDLCTIFTASNCC